MISEAPILKVKDGPNHPLRWNSNPWGTTDQGQLEITVRARGKYIVVVTVPGDEDFYCFVSADVQELAKRDSVKRSIVLPPED
jgi:hypothetical protein